MDPLFFFGSLRDQVLLEVVLDRPVSTSDVANGRADGFAALALGNEAYPCLAEQAGSTADGLIVHHLSEADLARLVFFEATDYALAPIRVETPDGGLDAQYFRGTEKIMPGTAAWDFGLWQRDERAVAIEAAREWMDYFGRYTAVEVEAFWPGIMTRARMRARAKAEAPATGALRQARASGDVERIRLDRSYTRYFAVEDLTLRHRLFDGGWSPEMIRTAFVSGDAVTVLPYDAEADTVMLIEQFRAPMAVRGDACPWGVEVIAGRIDQEMDAEGAARREALEEGGITLGRIEKIAGYYSSPGIASEHLTALIGEADLSGHGGTFGVASEDEDIRAFVVTLDEALTGITSGEINNGPAILSLLWLANQRDRLRSEWART
jgi:nudix-type nucleoside diphosphatase (YffH/AdpP family)